METNLYNKKIVDAASSVWNDAAVQQDLWNLFIDTIRENPNLDKL